jgi:uncharacterized protein with HEPN domain
MRREELYLRDIVEAADHIASFVADRGLSGFQGSETVPSAIVQNLAVIGEAASRVSGELKARHDDVRGMRPRPNGARADSRLASR